MPQPDWLAWHECFADSEASAALTWQGRPPDRLYALDGTRTGTFRFDDSAFFALGMTLANDWFYLLSSVSNIRPRRICAYTPQGQRVEPSDSGRYC